MTARRARAASAAQITIAPTDDRLALVAPGPDAVLHAEAARAISEWTDGWLAADRLERAGIAPPAPLLLHGPPGTGKTTVTRAIARRFAEVGIATYTIEAMRVVGKFLGDTTTNMVAASRAARAVRAALVFEEVDTLAATRSYGSGGETENARATTAIMRLLEEPGPSVLTSNRIDVLDPAVIRRCEYVVDMPEPTADARRAIVAAELGEDPGELPAGLELTRAVPLARRARRRAFLEQLSAARVLRTMLGLVEPPLALVIHCPRCGAQHVDEGEFAERPHRAHLCAGCGETWQPCALPTVGVRSIEEGPRR